MIERILGLGLAQAFRGLREGNPTLFVGGLLLVLLRYHRRSNAGKATSFTLKPGQSVALRVSRDGEDSVTYRIDA